MYITHVIIRVLLISALLTSGAAAVRPSIRECRRLLMTGQFEDCLKVAMEAIERRAHGEDWPVLKLQAERELGCYEEAAATAAAGIKRYPRSVRLHFEAFLSLRELGRNDAATRSLQEIDQLAAAAPWRYADADDLVALGKSALAAGADPKDVMEGFFDRARRNFSRQPAGVLASAELAIAKGDLRFAAELLAPAVESFPENAEILWAHYQALRQSHTQLAEKSRQAALAVNPRLTAALLAAANQRIDEEQFTDAEALITELRSRNPRHAEACGVLAAIYHLHGRPDQAAQVREAGLAHNPQNPVLDHHTGRTLSRRYRFREGAALQRRALELDPDFLPARIQLAQDLLRLGERDEGWRLAAEAHQRDGYDTQLFNLLQLRDSLDRFDILRGERFELHLSRQESRVFGTQVLRLLDRAWDDLTDRYGYVPQQPVIVEIFDRPDDFAVRTFGLPDVAGFLGVCFGRVITANSPTSQRGNPTNWKSVLWHEFCHVITLQMTGNRIPRWFSEGISVYEERRRDSRCGQRMSPTFRDRILNGEVTPVNRLSSAFLEAISGGDISFAYFESSMVVEYFVNHYGHDRLVAVLHDLNRGLQINDALERNSTDVETLDEEFRRWLKEQALSFAVGVEFDTGLRADTATPTEFRDSHPGNYPAGLAAVRLILGTDPVAAESELLRLIELFPLDDDPNGARKLLATIYRRQRRDDEERSQLEAHLAVTADDGPAAERLLELCVQQKDWTAAVAAGHMALAVDPAKATVLRQLADSAENVSNFAMAAECLRGLLELEASQAPAWRLRIARLVQAENPREARRQLLLALEEAPRFRAAHRLLLELGEERAP